MSADSQSEFQGEWPRLVRTRFRDQLGTVSPLLSVLDVAAQRFAAEIKESSTPDKAIRHVLSQHGAGRVYVDASCVPSAISQLHRAHVAYVVARADRLCFELNRVSLQPSSYLLSSRSAFCSEQRSSSLWTSSLLPSSCVCVSGAASGRCPQKLSTRNRSC